MCLWLAAWPAGTALSAVVAGQGGVSVCVCGGSAGAVIVVRYRSSKTRERRGSIGVEL